MWILLGEAGSKIEHIEGAPLRPEIAKEMMRIWLAKGALATTAIEGNTLSEEQVQQYLEGQLKLPLSQEYLRQEIANIVDACNLIAEGLRGSGPAPVSPDMIEKYNRMILRNLSLEEGVHPGEIRRHSVTVGSYRAAPAEDCGYLLERLCEWLNGPDFQVPDNRPDNALLHQIIKAIYAHLYLAWIHPFGDGNGRTARLVEFEILLSAGVPFPAAHLLSNHYNHTRAEYYRQLDLASKSGGRVTPFLAYAVQGLVDGLREQIDRIRQEQMDVAWENFVHDRFHGDKGVVAQRRRTLVLELSKSPSPVPRTNVLSISATVARAYADRTTKTLSRDINALRAMELVTETPEGLRALKETVSAFLPQKVGT